MISVSVSFQVKFSVLPRPSWTMPVPMMMKSASNLAYVKMSWMNVAHFTS